MKKKCGNYPDCGNEIERCEDRISYELKGIGTCFLCDECEEKYDERRKEVLDQQESDLGCNLNCDDENIQTEYECIHCNTPLKPLGSLDGCVVGQKVGFYCSDCEEEKLITLEPEELTDGWKDD